MRHRIPDKLFVLEMANNHMGDLEHGLTIIRAFATVCKQFPFNFAIKLQYRNLDTFIHPAYRGRDDIKYVKRFSETRLSREEMRRLVAEIKQSGFTAMCTPFDEVSVEHIIEDEFDIVKVGSCSFTDWPLLESVVRVDKPIILSTAGAALSDMDNVVAFFEHQTKDFALMHCIAEYPTRNDNMHLSQIDLLRGRYPHVRIGYSTHEHPDETMAVAMAIAKGCSIFEKHIGLATKKYALNEYSATPEQVKSWLKSAERAYGMLGTDRARIEPSQAELATLSSLRRGVFAKREIAAGEVLENDDVFMAIPTQPDQITANEWSKYTKFTTTSAIKSGEPVLHTVTASKNVRDKIETIVLKIKKMLEDGKIVVPVGAKLEISHHYGLDDFYEHGATLITLVNRDYCKKVLVMLPGQKHPTHYHKKKDETLHVLHGSLTLTLAGITKNYRVGELIVVEPGVPHSFHSAEGAVFEEISSTHFGDDSVYTDPSIGGSASRKTIVNHWNDFTPFDSVRGLKQLIGNARSAV
jgi:sialic acid synthase SpsE/quercetin dioxygenase-like cupin family protein